MALSGIAAHRQPGWCVDPRLTEIVATTVAAVHQRFTELKRDDLAMTLVEPVGKTVRGASHRGDQAIYPASLVKLFYLVAAHAWLDAGRLAPSKELDNALSAMIGESSNDATNHMVDLLTRTTGGPALPATALQRWLVRRQAINRYFAGWRCPEFAGINLTQKTWGEGPYGREWQSRFAVPDNGNRLTSDAIARLLSALTQGEAVSKRRSAAMLKLMARSIAGRSNAGIFDQVSGFLGQGLPPGAQLWSKAGWTSTTKHDAAIVELSKGRRFILVVCTTGVGPAQSRQLLPFIARRIVAELRRERSGGHPIVPHRLPHPHPSPPPSRGRGKE
jgi:beta-lactamase class A